MTDEQRREVFEKTVRMLKPAFERVVTDPEFRERFEATPLAVLDEMGVELDETTRAELEGRRFSDFWAERRQAAEGPVETRDLPPEEGELADEKLEGIAGGLGLVFGKGPIPSYAPPYLPVGPVLAGDNIATPGHLILSKDRLNLKKRGTGK